MTDEMISLEDLGGLGPLIGRGGQAEIHLAPGLTLPDAPGPLVFKKYRAGQNPPHGVGQLVSWRRGLSAAVRDRLDAMTLWPLRVVEHQGRIDGVLMRLIPDGFYQTRRLPGTRTVTKSVREVQNLLIPPGRAQAIGMPTPTERERFAICRDFAAVVHLLHRSGLVFGDLNARNALFRTDSRPRVMLVDCDAVRRVGSAAVVSQLDSPDWEAPERFATQYTDRFKFGLFMLRCLATGEQQSTTTDPARADAVLDEEGRALLRAALSWTPAERTTVQQWGLYLNRILQGAPLQSGPPRAVPIAAPPSPDRTAVGWYRHPTTGRWTRK